MVFPVLAILRGARDFRIHLYNIRQAWVWVASDIKWLLLMGFAAVSRRIHLPEQGKFNAAQKLNFMMVMSTYPIYIITGLIMWMSGVTLLAWLIHFGMAVVATPFILGHMFMATIPPSSRKGLQGMISGFVDRQWAKHHHARWYRENFQDAAVPNPAVAVSQDAANVVHTPNPAAGCREQPMRVNRLAAVGRELEAVTMRGAVDNAPNPEGPAVVRSGSPVVEGKAGRGNGASVDKNTARGVYTAADADRLLKTETLRAIVLGLQDGRRREWIAYGRAAVEAAAREGDWDLAAGLFRELWPDARDLNLTGEEQRAVVRRLLERKDFAMAAKAAALRVLQDPRDAVAINGLLKVAEASIRAQAWQDAINIYEFLSRHCPDSPYAGYFSRGIELAQQWSGNGNGNGTTAFATVTLDALGSETDPEARV
jgi:cytochrome b subunit of formate dehydrogenase